MNGLASQIDIPADLEPLLATHAESFSQFLFEALPIFLSKPYLAHSLIGDQDIDEVLTIRFDGFDCVTLVETLLSFYLSKTPEAFVDNLIALRYYGGVVAWTSRKHYLSGWCHDNCKRAILLEVTPQLFAPTVSEHSLSALEGLPSEVAHITTAPLSEQNVERLSNGDLLCFVSERDGLDYFHTGFLTKRCEAAFLFHASQKQGMVVEENLEDFLARTDCSEVSVFRILDWSRHEQVNPR